MLPGETLAAWRRLPASVRAARSDGAWAAGLAEGFPASWVGRLMRQWRKGHADDATAANLAHLGACRNIASAHRAGLAPDANDAELCEEARQSARDMDRRVSLALQGYAREFTGWGLGHSAPEGVRALAAWAEVRHWLESRGLGDAVASLVKLMQGARRRGGLALDCVLRRVTCDRWWRRVLRKLQARAVEATARGLELVSKAAGCYVSDDGLRRRTGQRVRNAAALEAVEAVNEHAQRYTLAELAARGAANREIRRHELMTRIAGFEVIARECGHAAYFVTVTCPSRMHAMRTAAGGKVERNPKFDGTAPDAAQRYLSRQWARFRAAADRRGLGLYGFRIAEPNHDGTPHWHALLFFPERAECGRLGYRVLVRLLRRYFLWAEPGAPERRGAEHGARRHRVKVERIDWTRGSAAGYVAKYVAKNIDGYKVERDLFGNDAMESSRRVEAWAATWRVRQFQQIGGAPVTIWRELRRLHPEQGDAAPPVALALEAVNITAGADDHETEAVQRYTAAHGWATYLHLQGGSRVPRRELRVRLLKEQTGELGRYGDLMPAKVIGVACDGFRSRALQLVGWVNRTVRSAPQRVAVEVESERAAWVIVSKGAAAPQAIQAGGEAARPWSPVNNCTGPITGPGRERHRKKGRWATFQRGRGPKSTKEPPPCPEPPRPSLPN